MLADQNRFILTALFRGRYASFPHHWKTRVGVPGVMRERAVERVQSTSFERRRGLLYVSLALAWTAFDFSRKDRMPGSGCLAVLNFLTFDTLLHHGVYGIGVGS